MRAGASVNKAVRHMALEVDGSAKSLRGVADALKGMNECVAAVGTVDDKVAQPNWLLFCDRNCPICPT